MVFISKLLYYASFSFASLYALFLVLSPVNNLLNHPTVRSRENIIMAFGAAIVITAVYFGRHIMTEGEKYFQGTAILIGGCVLSFIIIMIGLLFFNGPIRWN